MGCRGTGWFVCVLGVSAVGACGGHTTEDDARPELGGSTTMGGATTGVGGAGGSRTGGTGGTGGTDLTTTGGACQGALPTFLAQLEQEACVVTVQLGLSGLVAPTPTNGYVVSCNGYHPVTQEAAFAQIALMSSVGWSPELLADPKTTGLYVFAGQPEATAYISEATGDLVAMTGEAVCSSSRCIPSSSWQPLGDLGQACDPNPPPMGWLAVGPKSSAFDGAGTIERLATTGVFEAVRGFGRIEHVGVAEAAGSHLVFITVITNE